ncbi:MAG: hypothetical protein AAFU85_03635 [Planctomycetota bacterium]
MQSSQHLARITTLSSGRALTTAWALGSTLFIGLTPVLMTTAPVLLLSSLAVWVPQLWTAAAVGAAVSASLLLLGYWLISYPEWPANQGLRKRLVRAIRRRDPREIAAEEPLGAQRMVEWVPRDNWIATELETASDVMLIRVDECGIDMEGDKQRYRFPAAAIIDVGVESTRPAGCFHQMHFVVLWLRTETGPIEFPIAYRDHGLSSLASKIRYQDAMELCQRIANIATGGDFSYQHSTHETPSRPAHQPLNPFAAPRMT